MGRKYANSSVAEMNLIENTVGLLKGHKIKIPDEAGIINYLSSYPDLVDLVKSISRATAKKFGNGSQLSLEVYSDPEIADKFLVLYVRQVNYDKNLYAELRKFRIAYDSLFNDQDGYFMVTTDFQKPVT